MLHREIIYYYLHVYADLYTNLRAKLAIMHRILYVLFCGNRDIPGHIINVSKRKMPLETKNKIIKMKGKIIYGRSKCTYVKIQISKLLDLLFLSCTKKKCSQNLVYFLCPKHTVFLYSFSILLESIIFLFT